MTEIGIGYIKAACEAAGVKRHVYNQAVKKKERGETLSKDQLDVLFEYKRLVDEAKLKYAKIQKDE